MRKADTPRSRVRGMGVRLSTKGRFYPQKHGTYAQSYVEYGFPIIIWRRLFGPDANIIVSDPVGVATTAGVNA